MSRLGWPMAATIIFAGMPAFVLLFATLCAYPAVMLPLLATAVGAVWLARRQTRLDALAERAAADYPFAAALVAQPLPDLPTVPLRRKAMR